jgi:hypothetical protein
MATFRSLQRTRPTPPYEADGGGAGTASERSEERKPATLAADRMADPGAAMRRQQLRSPASRVL